jgi:MFS superfamily sulfate permease-like transporter
MMVMRMLAEKDEFLKNLKHDLPSSVVVFFVALPLCLGIALASGAPLYSGIIAGVVGGIVVGSLSNSSLGVTGPAAGLAVIVYSAIEQLGFEVFLVAVVLAGLIQSILGLLRAGIIAYYFPTAVIKGMLTAIGIIIILKQIPHAFGYDADYEGDLSFVQADGNNTFSGLLHILDSVHPGAIFVSILSLAILFIWEAHLARRYAIFKLIQGPLVAVAAGMLFQFVTSNYFPSWSFTSLHLVTVPVANSTTEFFNQFYTPAFRAISNPNVWVVAFTLAIVASLETLLSVEATDKLDPQRRTTDTNRELLAQGTGNVIAGLIGGIPLTQVILRSSANIHSGGKTKASTILHGTLLLVCVVTIPHLLNLVPLAVLAGILLVIGYKLANPSTFKKMYQQGWSQFLPFMATVVGVVTTDLLKGIVIGMVVAVMVILRNSYKNSHFLHREQNNNGSGKSIKITLAEEVVFLNKASILRELNNIPADSQLTIDMSKSVSVDLDVMEVIEDFKRRAQSRNIKIRLITNTTPKKSVETKQKEPTLVES